MNYKLSDVLTPRELSIFRSQVDKYRRTFNSKVVRTNEPDDSLLEKVGFFLALIAFFASLVWIINLTY